MKSVILALTLALLPAPALAAESHEVVQGKVALYVMGIQCIVRAGTHGKLEDRLYTQLGSIDNPPNAIGLSKLAKLKPKALMAPGCDLTALDLIVKDSSMYFGFIHGTPVTVTKHTYPSVRDGRGNCVAHYSEKIEVELGGGIVISSNANDLVPMNDCATP